MRTADIIPGVTLALTACGSAGESVTDAATEAPTVAVTEEPDAQWERECPGSNEKVVYYVEGTARSASITAEMAGGTSQATNRTVPLQNNDGVEGLVAGCLPPEAFTYISAQNEGASGSIKCRIERDGRTVSEAASEGEYVIATCDN